MPAAIWPIKIKTKRRERENLTEKTSTIPIHSAAAAEATQHDSAIALSRLASTG
jgi:hypothetical protein